MKTTALAAIAAGLIGAQTFSMPVHAQASDAKKDEKPKTWIESIKYSAVIDVGFTANPDDPKDGRSFGRLFDDQPNTFALNQLRLTAERPIDATIDGYDFGFKLQGMFGTDARYTRFLEEFDGAGVGPNRFDIVEANVQAHTPWFTPGGFDIKIGQFVTSEGAETIDTATNYFYSHSYIFNFGIPFKHTGVMTALHALPFLDIYAGVTTGVNTQLGEGDNNDRPAFHGGIGLTLLDGKLTSLATTHIGPENAELAVVNGILPANINANSAYRYLNDITTTWKVTDKLTLINDLNYIRDEGLNGGLSAAEGFGMAQYVVYALNDMYALAARVEYWRDVQGVFVCQFADDDDFIRAEKGLPVSNPRSVCGGKTTYGAITLGVNIKPTLNVPYLESLVVRPEIRYDASLNDTRPFNDSQDKGMFTFGIDAVLTF